MLYPLSYQGRCAVMWLFESKTRRGHGDDTTPCTGPRIRTGTEGRLKPVPLPLGYTSVVGEGFEPSLNGF